MSDAIEKASAEAVEAARQSDQFAVMLAAMTAAQAVQQAEQSAAPQKPLQAHPVGVYFAGGCLALVALVVVAFVLVAILIGLSIALVVLAIGMISLVICLLVLRSMWTAMRKGQGR